jgi:hypothetical protein
VTDDKQALRHLADAEIAGPIRLPSGRVVCQLPNVDPLPVVEHHTETLPPRTESGPDVTEYTWTCTCGAGGGPWARRTAATEERLIHERENRP